MKNIFYILLLLPTIIFAQYPSNSGHKITLGEQTTADGLIWRGVLADTGIITPLSDTSAYIILDTVNHRFYNYNRATNVWSMAGVGSISSGLTGTLPVANGGTGSATQNFVDLTTNQTVGGLKTFSNIFTSTATVNAVFAATELGTAARYLNIRNTSGGFLAGTEGSAGGFLIAGLPAYYGTIVSRAGLGISANDGTTNHMTILSGGNVGIGTATPAEKLSVNGAIISTGGITGHGANRTSISQEGANGAYWQSYGANASTIGRFTLRQASSDFSLTRIPLVIESTGAATFSGSVTSNATTSFSFYSGTYVSNSLGDGSFATYSGRIRENASYNLNIDLYDRNAATWRTPLSFNNTGGAATFGSSVTATQGEFISGGQDGALGSVVRISTASTNADARNWGIVNTWNNYGDLTFRVSNAQGGNALSAGSSRMVILSSGNVGIGTTSPGSRLVVKGVDGTSTNSALNVTNSSDASLLFVRNDGNVGIGTASPLGPLEVRAANRAGGSDGILQVNSNNSAGINLGGSLSFGGVWTSTSVTEWSQISGRKENSTNDNYAGYLSFATRPMGGVNTERMRITSGGNVFINNPSGVSLNGLTNFLSVSSTTFNLFDISRFSDNVFGPNFYFVKSRNGSIGGNTIVASGDNLGNINWVGANGTGFTDAASIKVEVDGAPGASNDMPGRLVFLTTADGAGSPTERMRITSSGQFLFKGGSTESLKEGMFVNDNTDFKIYSSISGSVTKNLTFWTSNSSTVSEKMRITSGGNVGIGTVNPDFKLEVVDQVQQVVLQISGLNENTDNILNGGTAVRFRNLSTINGTKQSMVFADASNNAVASIQSFNVNQTTHEGALAFGVRNSSGDYGLKMYINGNGNVGIGTASPGAPLHIAFNLAKTVLGDSRRLILDDLRGGTNERTEIGMGYTGAFQPAIIGYITTNNAGSTLGDIYFATRSVTTNTAPTERMRITSAGVVSISNLGSGAVTATSGVLSTTSDMTLKIDDGYIDNALEKISQLKPRYFYWKEESGLPTDIRQLGFYAQEVNQALGEEAANTPKNENDKWGIYDRGIIAMLTKAIQEQQLIIKALEQRILNLENK